MQFNNLRNLVPEFSEAEQFVTLLTGSPDTEMLFQPIHDSDKQRKSMALRSNIRNAFERLTELNRQGFGIFAAVNVTAGTNRKNDDILAARALFAEKDDGNFPPFQLEPSFTIQSKRGPHAYWVFENPVKMERDEYKHAQRMLINSYGSDESITDLARIMRMPGFFHAKEPKDPFLVKLSTTKGRKYLLDQILESHLTTEALVEDVSRDARSFDIVAFFKEKNLYLKLISPGKHSVKCPWASEHSKETADSSTAIFDGTGPGEKFGFKCFHSHCSKRNLQTIVNYFSYEQVSKFMDTSRGYLPADIADSFLQSVGLKDCESLKIQFWRGDFYRFNGVCYELFPEAEIRAAVMNFLRNRDMETRKRANQNFVSQVTANIESISLLPGKMTPPYVFGSQNFDLKNLFIFKNGVLEANEKNFELTKEPILYPHSEKFFSMNSLPYEYRPEAKAEKWINFLNEMLPDKDVQLLLQEWFGYNLVLNNSMQKFMIFVGKGANGKSVVCTVLRELLGPSNVSAVSIEAFDAKRTFLLAAMENKLANIVEEISSTDRIAEGMLKGYVSGSPITIERKGKDPFETVPMARLTFATNLLPRFKDVSDGIWRRLLTISFLEQIKDEAKQDRRLATASFWRDSNELPGVFNWALEGLERVKKQGKFTEPKSSVEQHKEYRNTSNPVGDFISTSCEFVKGARTGVNTLYRAFREAERKSGMRLALAQREFTEELARQHPSLLKSTHPRLLDGERQREWFGIRLKGVRGFQ